MSKRKKKKADLATHGGERAAARDVAEDAPPPEAAASPPANAPDAPVRLAPNEGGETAPEPFTDTE